jgi:hypothetical protein
MVPPAAKYHNGAHCVASCSGGRGARAENEVTHVRVSAMSRHHDDGAVVHDRRCGEEWHSMFIGAYDAKSSKGSSVQVPDCEAH